MSKLKAFVLCSYVDQVENSLNSLKLFLCACLLWGPRCHCFRHTECWNMDLYMASWVAQGTYVTSIKYLYHYPFSMEPFDKEFYVLWRISYYLSDPKI